MLQRAVHSSRKENSALVPGTVEEDVVVWERDRVLMIPSVISDFGVATTILVSARDFSVTSRFATNAAFHPL